MRRAGTILSVMLLFIMLAAAAGFLYPAAKSDSAPTPAAVASAAPETAPISAPVSAPESTPEPTPTPDPQPEYFVISMVGDCTLAGSQHIKGTGASFEGVVGDDFEYPFAKTVQYFEADYLSLANLECALTDSTASNGATFTFAADPKYAQVLTSGGIDAVVLGNNHSGDYGERGREDTAAALDAAGIVSVPDGECRIYERGGPKVGIYSKLYPTAQNVRDGTAALEEAGADIIIVALHWGLEGSYRVTAEQSAVGRAAIDAGADIVYGCHPHVLQRIEEYAGKYILYSLGNWTFGGNTAPRDRDTAIARVTFTRSPDGKMSICGCEYIPCELSGTPNVNDYQPHPYDKGSADYSRAVSKLEGSFDGPDLTIDYSAFHND